MKIRLLNSSLKKRGTDSLRLKPVFGWRNAAFLPIFVALWALLVFLRRHLITLHCTSSSLACQAADLWQIDQWVVPLVSPQADGYSYLTQNYTGAVAFFAPFLIALYQGAGDSLVGRPFSRLLKYGSQALRDLGLLLFTVLLNGVLNELARVVVQRPRPFVYMNALYFGAEAGNYTSFYSGHTSFTASASLGVVLLAVARGATRLQSAILLLLSLGVTFATGSFRVLSARHFTTDVMAGAFAGFCVALAVALLHKQAWHKQPH